MVLVRRIAAALCLTAFTAKADDFADSPKFTHAMEIETRKLEGFPVVFHYGEIRPDFEDRSENPHRQRQSLDGTWRFRFDPKNAGLAEGWHSAPDLSGWQTVSVPHCWDTMEGGRFWDWSDRTEGNPPMYDGVA